MMYGKSALVASAVLILLALQPGNAAAAPASSALASGIDTQYEDSSIRPQDDIYKYLNGKWLASTQIPADKPGYGTFDKLFDESQDQLKQLVDVVSKNASAPAGSDEAKIRDLYNSFMDEAHAESLGIKPLAPELARIDAIKSKQDIPELMGHLQRIGVTTPFTPGVHLDNKDATKYVFDLGQDGLGLPDRDYYLKDDDAKLKEIRGKYQLHVAHALEMLGDAQSRQEAAQILALETRLAKVQWTKVELRDPVKAYNKVELSALPTLAKGFDWHRYLVTAGVAGKVSYVIVSQPSYQTGFAKILQDTPLPVWKVYFRWHLLSDASPYLSKAFVDDRFAFYGTVLSGVPENRPRWKRGISLVDGSIGEGLGKLYVAKYFPPDRKARADELVRNLLAAYKQDIGTLDWMTADTKQQAQAKLAKIMVKIGYPSKWRDYSTLTIRADDLLGNVQRANEFEWQRNINKLGQPVDRGEWGMNPQTVNAYYNPEMNEIVFPAAILQPPFFNAAADDAVNYGAIGSVIGHEISHGFDDQGAQYDGDGNLRNWWTEEDHKRFDAKTKALVAEYGAFEPVAGYHLNGELTLGENIADNSGLAIAYKAYKISLAGKPAPKIDGLSGDERFYLGFAQEWREKLRDNYAVQLIKTDPHSMGVDRVLGTLVNQPGFYETFNVKAGDKMYVPPQKRVVIW
ncbi:MAG TPA: M13-type metalloendopeptidase [Steroidobacteraceae bacterium]|nr:M13-type metalloendopeptidase [Steroidobacteraceae bacterium]